MALQIGKHTFEFPYFVAPMAGITNAPFRLLMREMGAGLVVSELISSTGIQYTRRKTFELCQYFEEERPVGLQIFGETPEHLSFAANFLETKGVDFIDINLGCPVPKVVSKGGGAAMLRDPMALYKALSAVKQAIKIPLTIKIRTGWDACSINAIENIRAAGEAGVTWVAVHGRTRAQGYEGHADWDLIAQLKAASPVPIIGNGDILTAEQAIYRRRQSGCDAVMIGRGALRNPHIFLEIAELEGRPLREKPTYWELIERHAELMKRCMTPFYVGVQLRKFMTWYSAGIEGASKFRVALYAIPSNPEETDSSLKEVYDLGRQFFNPPGGVRKQASFLKEPFLKGGHG